MLTASAIGMAGYGAYEAITGVMDLVGRGRLELWAELALVLFGVLLVVAAAFVRVLLPGGFELALGAILALQALAIHNAVHFYETPTLIPHIARGVFGATLIALASAGSRPAP